MTTVYFVRHAEPNLDNHDDMTRELTPKGMADRILVTEFLCGRDISAVYSSPYKRAVDTVKDFADKCGLTVEIDNDLRERRVDSGWIEDIDSFFRKQWSDHGYKLSDGECLAEVCDRNIAALERIIRGNEGKSIAVGSHGTAISVIINYFVPGFGYEEFQKIKRLMPWIVRLVFEGDNCVRITGYDLFSGSEWEIPEILSK